MPEDDYGYNYHTFDGEFKNEQSNGVYDSIIGWLSQDDAMRGKLEELTGLPLDETSFEKISKFDLEFPILWELVHSGLIYFGSGEWLCNIDTAAWMAAGGQHSAVQAIMQEVEALKDDGIPRLSAVLGLEPEIDDNDVDLISI